MQDVKQVRFRLPVLTKLLLNMKKKHLFSAFYRKLCFVVVVGPFNRINYHICSAIFASMRLFWTAKLAGLCKTVKSEQLHNETVSLASRSKVSTTSAELD